MPDRYCWIKGLALCLLVQKEHASDYRPECADPFFEERDCLLPLPLIQ
jgi:hypothetical protein